MAMPKCFGLIFSNMHDESIGELTQSRTTGSVPFAGRYRLVDFHLSNFVNAGITEVGVITRSNYQSLMEHIGSGREWDLDRKRGGLYILPPFHHRGAVMYRGRIEALANAMPIVSRSGADYVVMADCNVLYNTDLRPILEAHIASGAQITAAVSERMVASASEVEGTTLRFGADRRVTGVSIGKTPPPDMHDALNLYIMDRIFLEKLVAESVGLGQYSFKECVLRARCRELRIFAYPIDDVCLRIGSLQEYYNASMLLLQPDIRGRLFKPGFPVYTRVRDEVPVKYGLDAGAHNALIADGCIVEGEVENSILSRGVRVRAGASVRDSILMRGVVVGPGASLDYVVADRGVVIGANRALMGAPTHPLYLREHSAVD